MSSNAAERLLDDLAALEDEYENTRAFPGTADLSRLAIGIQTQGIRLVNDALAAERRATVERIRVKARTMLGTAPWGIRHLTEHDLDAIADAEAKR